MNSTTRNVLYYCLPSMFLLTSGLAWAQKPPASSPIVSSNKFDWQVVVNNSMVIPGDSRGRKFNSYNQPSVNINQLVVFRGRSKGGTGGEGGQGGMGGGCGHGGMGNGCGGGEMEDDPGHVGMGGKPAHGVFVRDMAQGTPIITISDRNTLLPQPNNLGTTFIEPPSFPRIDMWTNTIVSPGNHQPSWRYRLFDGISQTRSGTTGIYTNPFGILITGMSNLGGAPGLSFFAVPESNAVKFDVFPGAPAVADGATIVFKGNYSVPDPSHPGTSISKTGVYFRNLTNAPIRLSNDTRLEPAGGTMPVMTIADTSTLIPGTGTKFGSLAPPSAAGRQAAFAGFDNEENPTKGGIYLTKLTGPRPPLTPLIEIGGPVPGEKKGAAFNKLSECVSFDGRFVAFWGAWGSQTKTLILQCPAKGNQIRNAYCNEQHPNGYKATVPLHQGIFVHDIQTGKTRTVAKAPDDFDDFVNWKFTGHAPGMGESEEPGEPARWRSVTYVAVSGLVDGNLADATFHVAFEAKTARLANGTYVIPVDGIYLRKGPGNPSVVMVIQTGMDGTSIDPEAVSINETTGASVALPITEVGIERDGFRGNSLVLNVRMGAEETGWAGIYLTVVPDDLIEDSREQRNEGRHLGRQHAVHH